MFGISSFKSVIAALFYKVVLASINFSISLITGRYLGAAGRGYYTNTTVYLTYYSPVIGSFSEYIPYGINKRKQDPGTLFSTVLFFYIIFAGTLFIAAAAGTTWLLKGGLFGWEEMTTRGLWAAGILAPFAMFHVYVTSLMWGLNELRWLNRLNTVQAVIFLGMLIGVVWGIRPSHDHDALFVIGAWFLSFVITSTVSAWVVFTKVKIKVRPRLDHDILRDAFQFGSRLIPGNILYGLNNRIDVTLVWGILGAAHTGIYGVAVTSAEMLNLISSSILQVVLTRVSSLNEKNSTLLTARIFRHTAVVLLVSGIGMYIFMPYIINLYGKDFEASKLNFAILLPGVALFSLANVLISFYNNQLGKPQITTVLQIISILTNVILSVILLPRIGESGSAIAKTVAYTSLFLAAVLYFCRATKYPFYKLFYLQADEWEQYKMLLRKAENRLKGNKDS